VARAPILTVSNGPEQDVRIERDLEAAERLGLGSFRPLEPSACRGLVAAEGVRRGHLEEHGLLVDPAALVRGLRDAAIRRGVRVHERTPARAIRPGPSGVEVRTPGGEVRAERAVLALGAYGAALPRIRRFLFTVYASIVVTEPLSEEQWARVGWRGGLGVEDKRTMPHIFRPTPDGRILWGGRDAPYVPGGPDPRFDRIPWAYARLEETFRATFPQLAEVRIEGVVRAHRRHGDRDAPRGVAGRGPGGLRRGLLRPRGRPRPPGGGGRPRPPPRPPRRPVRAPLRDRAAGPAAPRAPPPARGRPSPAHPPGADDTGGGGPAARLLARLLQ